MSYNTGGQGHYGYPHQQHSKPRRNGCLVSFLVAVGIMVVVGGFAGCAAILTAASNEPPEVGVGPTGDGSTGGGEKSESPDALEVGDTGEVGDWEVAVTSVEETSTYGDEFMEETAQGVFKVVSIEVTNTGDEAVFFDSSAVSLVDADGKVYSSQATLSESDLFLEQINPGNSASGEAVVDVPSAADVTGVQVEDVLSLGEPVVFELK